MPFQAEEWSHLGTFLTQKHIHLSAIPSWNIKQVANF